MSQNKNPFGGGAPNALYFPMSEDEQEVLSRIMKSEELKVEVLTKGPYGVTKPDVKRLDFKHGDSRVQIDLYLLWSSPIIWIPCHVADLKLYYQNRLLFSEEQSLMYDGLAEQVGVGKTLVLRWDIQIKKINPELVKLVKPGATGLTSRVGNTHYDDEKNKLLLDLRKSQEKVKEDSKKKLDAIKKQAITEYKNEAK